MPDNTAPRKGLIRLPSVGFAGQHHLADATIDNIEIGGRAPVDDNLFRINEIALLSSDDRFGRRSHFEVKDVVRFNHSTEEYLTPKTNQLVE